MCIVAVVDGSRVQRCRSRNQGQWLHMMSRCLTFPSPIPFRTRLLPPARLSAGSVPLVYCNCHHHHPHSLGFDITLIDTLYPPVDIKMFCIAQSLVLLSLSAALVSAGGLQHQHSHSHKNRGPSYAGHSAAEKSLEPRSTAWWTSNAQPKGSKKWVFAHFIVGNSYVSTCVHSSGSCGLY